MANSGQGHLQTSLGSQNVSLGTFVGQTLKQAKNSSHEPYDKQLVSLRTGTHVSLQLKKNLNHLKLMSSMDRDMTPMVSAKTFVDRNMTLMVSNM